MLPPDVARSVVQVQGTAGCHRAPPLRLNAFQSSARADIKYYTSHDFFLSVDVLGRPVVVASHRNGLVEGQLHMLPPEASGIPLLRQVFFYLKNSTLGAICPTFT